jgi:hypothetical protein
VKEPPTVIDPSRTLALSVTESHVPVICTVTLVA